MALALLATIAVIWFATSKPKVRMDDFVGRFDERRAELNRMLSHPSDTDLNREDRIALSIAVGARLRTFENTESQASHRLAVALGRKFGIRHEAFGEADRELILVHPEVLGAIEQLSRGGEPVFHGKRIDTVVEFDLRALAEYLALMISFAVDRGDEPAIVGGFERLMLLAEDCFERRTPELAYAGTYAFRTAIRSAGEVERVDKGFNGPDEEAAFMAPSMERMLGAVPSEEGRARLAAAIERTQAWIPTARDGAIFGFLMSAYYHQRDVDAKCHGAELIPGRWLEGLEELILWQGEELKRTEEPGFQLSKELSEASDRAHRRLSRSARIGDGLPWVAAREFEETNELGERAKRWIAAGMVD